MRHACSLGRLAANLHLWLSPRISPLDAEYVFSVVGHRCRDAVISVGERSDVGACGQSRQNVASLVLARIWASRQRCPTTLN